MSTVFSNTPGWVSFEGPSLGNYEIHMKYLPEEYKLQILIQRTIVQIVSYTDMLGNPKRKMSVIPKTVAMCINLDPDNIPSEEEILSLCFNSIFPHICSDLHTN